jgi:Zn-dependent protease/predicted transcriptional regulator
MKGSIKLVTIAGIGVFVHWTFLILIGWILVSHALQGEGIAAALRGVFFVLAVFACVVAHEFGHALTARRFGIVTRDITLLPIGGVARLERIPEDPVQELWVAVAGPAVNVLIAAVLLGILAASVGLEVLLPAASESGEPSLALFEGPFVAELLWVNVALVVFNMVPAFPMDGGRILRALLATRIPYVRATRIAAMIGQGVAILFGLLGLFGQPMLMLVALFVYLGAQAEYQQVERRSFVQGVPVRAATVTRFQVLHPWDPLSRGVDELLAGSQTDFPVVDDGRLVGLLTRQDLLRALQSGRRDAPVSEVMRTDVPPIAPSDPLENVFRQMQDKGVATLPVVDEGRLVGIMTQENVSEWILVRMSLDNNERVAG